VTRGYPTLTWPLLLPLTSSIIYVGGVLLLKRAADLGVGVWRVIFVSNLATAVVFLPLLGLGGPSPDVEVALATGSCRPCFCCSDRSVASLL
jgi:hypothetical protein